MSCYRADLIRRNVVVRCGPVLKNGELADRYHEGDSDRPVKNDNNNYSKSY